VRTSAADFDLAIQLEPKPGRYDSRGEVYRAKGDLDCAIADYDRAIELNPRYVRARFNRASAYLLKGDQDRAMADLDEAVRLDPTGGYPFANRGRAHFYAANFDAATSDFVQAFAAQPHYAANMIWLYLSRARLGDQAAAAELEANARNLKQTDWRYSIVKLFIGHKGPEAALSAASGPDQQCEMQFYAGEWYVLHNDHRAASQAFEAALSTCVKTYIEYQTARAELSHLRR
jgi:lipoprotein NlpI